MLTGSAVAQERVKVKVAALTLPVFNPIIVNLMKEKGIDARHGLEMDVKAYPSIAAFDRQRALGRGRATGMAVARAQEHLGHVRADGRREVPRKASGRRHHLRAIAIARRRR
jgi:hypothetical protein